MHNKMLLKDLQLKYRLPSSTQNPGSTPNYGTVISPYFVHRVLQYIPVLRVYAKLLKPLICSNRPRWQGWRFPKWSVPLVRLVICWKNLKNWWWCLPAGWSFEMSKKWRSGRKYGDLNIFFADIRARNCFEHTPWKSKTKQRMVIFVLSMQRINEFLLPWSEVQTLDL